MHNLPFDFTAADRSALIDEVTKLIARAPRLVGTEVNWIERAAQTILRAFEEQTMLGLDRLRQVEIEEHIRKFATSPSVFAAGEAAANVFAKLQDFFEERNQPSWMKDPSIPTDETHEFSLGFKEIYERLGQVSPASEIFTEAEALAEMARYKEANGVQRLILLARPKPPRWKVLDYQG